MSEQAKPKRGDRFVWATGSNFVSVLVRRVARDGSWADIACATGSHRWTKRQPLPFPVSFTRQDHPGGDAR